MKFNLASLFLVFTILFSSCAVIQKNGIKQSRKYRVTNVFQVKKHNVDLDKATTESEVISLKHEVLPETITIPVTRLRVEQIPVSKIVPDKENQVEPTMDELHSPPFVKQDVALEDWPSVKFEDEPEVKKVRHWGAAAGLTVGILGLFIGGIIFGTLAIIFSSIALSNIQKHPEQFSGFGLAVAGLVIGIIDIVAVLILLALIL